MEQQQEQDKKRESAYTAEFIEKRGVEKVAKESGLNRQTVRQVLNGDHEAGRKVLIALAKTYPNEYDINQELLGGEVTRRAAEPASADAVKDALIEGYKREIALLKDTVSILRSVVGSQLGKDMESKTESTNDANQGEQLEIGTEFSKRRASRFIALSLRDATGTICTFENPAPMYPPRR